MRRLLQEKKIEHFVLAKLNLASDQFHVVIR
jgi:hypothetical protein